MTPLLTLAFVLASVATPLSRVDRIEYWVGAAQRHQPGTIDAAAVVVGGWSGHDLQTLWTDLYVLAELVHRSNANYFTLYSPNRVRRERIQYTTDEFKRLKAIADHARETMGADGTLRRGALLHTDIAMHGAADTPDAIESLNRQGPQRITVHIGDGRALDVGVAKVHWETARMLVDRGPRDTFARDWYRATAAWMQRIQDFDLEHVDHAVQQFPDDPGLLFLDGCMHEILASAEIQTSVQSMRLPSGVSMNVGSSRAELKIAENALRRAVVLNPDEPEWILHHGRVLDLLGEHETAAAELTRASAAIDDEELAYVATLFRGAAQEAAGRLDDARVSYAAAAERFPAAQSPIVALMQLARRRGDRAAALEELARLSRINDDDAGDPWWSYSESHVRNTAVLFEALWKPFRDEGAK
jgi:tetratricopeptide (TPR) repeat protein